jgi:hypothetical protein
MGNGLQLYSGWMGKARAEKGERITLGTKTGGIEGKAFVIGAKTEPIRTYNQTSVAKICGKLQDRV